MTRQRLNEVVKTGVSGSSHQIIERENQTIERSMEEEQIPEARNAHWHASAVGDANAEHDIYDDDAICDYPQSGANLRTTQFAGLAKSSPRQIVTLPSSESLGKGDLWIKEYTITYQGRPSYTVSMMEFRNGEVVRET